MIYTLSFQQQYCIQNIKQCMNKQSQPLYQEFIMAMFETFWEREKAMNCYNVERCKPIIPQSLFRDKHRHNKILINQSLGWKQSTIHDCGDSKSEIKSRILQEFEDGIQNNNHEPNNNQIIENSKCSFRKQKELKSLSMQAQKRENKSQIKNQIQCSKIDEQSEEIASNKMQLSYKLSRTKDSEKQKRVSQSCFVQQVDSKKEQEQQIIPNGAKFYQFISKSSSSRKGKDDPSMNNSYQSENTIIEHKNLNINSLIVSDKFHLQESSSKSTIISKTDKQLSNQGLSLQNQNPIQENEANIKDKNQEKLQTIQSKKGKEQTTFQQSQEKSQQNLLQEQKPIKQFKLLETQLEQQKIPHGKNCENDQIGSSEYIQRQTQQTKSKTKQQNHEYFKKQVRQQVKQLLSEFKKQIQENNEKMMKNFMKQMMEQQMKIIKEIYSSKQ